VPEGFSEPGSGVIKLSDPTAGQIAVGKTWAAVTLKSGSLLQLPLSRWGGLSGRSTSITLPGDASTVPLGAAFWDDTLGFDPAHSVDSFALVTSQGQVYPVAGPTPVFPSNAPCWVAKDVETSGTRATRRARRSPYSSAMARAGCFTSRFRCRGWSPT